MSDQDWSSVKVEDKSPEKLEEGELEAEILRLFHRAWGDCRDSPDYHKATWGRLQNCLNKKGIKV